jgi:hypothetical protein
MPEQGPLEKDTAEVILKSVLSLGERINDLDRIVVANGLATHAA